MTGPQTIAYVLINTIFAHVLFVVTMRANLKYSLKKTIIILASMIAIEQLIPIFMLAHGSTLDDLQNIYFVLSLVFFFPTNAFIVKKNALFSAFFTLVLLGTFLDITTLLGETLERAHWLPVDQILNININYIYQFFIIFISIPFAFLFAKKLLHPVVETTSHMHFWRYLWLLPGYYFLLFRIAVYPKIFNTASGWSSASVLLTALWCAGSLVTYCIILAMIHNISKNADAKLKLEVAQTQTKMQKEEYMLLQENMEETRAAKHDLRHHLRVLRGYAEKGNCQQIENYIDHYFDDVMPLDAQPICENYELDTILGYFIELAKKRGIHVTHQISLPSKMPLPESDVCVVAANLLENALEACTRQTDGKRFIDIKMGIAGKSMVIIKIYNSYSGEIKCKDNVFQSAKHKGMGIGTQSVGQMVRKYNGVLKFEYEGTVFKASVLLSSAK